jgi:serine/threonine-protein kinase
MTERYQQAKTIVLEAMEQEADACPAFLDTRCGGDAALRQEVEWLLQVAETRAGDGFVPGWPDGGMAVARLPDGAEIAAAAPDRYRIVRLLGEGGMGVVYLAERTEGDSRQTVALKFLNAGSHASPRLMQRLADERRILASLNHPNIAHLVDGGSTADGRPFIAMEYVDGQRIDQWCAQRQLSLLARIGLFLKVCAAVKHAHQRLVIHRDLKPANILVTADGEPKLLDFGIARLLDDDLSTPATQTSHRALTLAYASPEQIEGHPLTTAADTWALGVVLYELLSGERPHQALESGHLLPSAIVSGEVDPPSRRTRSVRGKTAASPVQSDGLRIPADIDAIVLKALRHDPAQRYASVDDLATDLQRFLASRPVLARRGHALYRLRRFVWRQRLGVAVAAILVLLVSGFVLDREQQLRRVEAERNKALALSGFMSDLFANADPSQSRGEQVTVREVLDRGASELGTRDDLDPGTRTDLGLAIADAYLGLEMSRDSLPLLEQALRQMEELPAPAAKRATVMARLATSHSKLGENTKAIELFQQAQALLDPGKGGEELQQWVGLRLSELRNRDLKADEPPLVLAKHLQELIVQLGQHDPASAGESLVTAHETLANAYQRAGQWQAAIASEETALQLAQVHFRDQPNYLLAVRSNHAAMLLERDPKQGLQLLQATDRDYARLIGEHTTQRAILLNQISVALNRVGRTDEALATMATALEAARRSAGPDNRLYLQLGANQAQNLIRAGQHDQAVELLHELLPQLKARLAPGVDTVNYAYALGALGRVLLVGKQEATAAIQVLEQAEQVLGAHAGDFLVVYHGILENQVRAHLALKQKARAMQAAERYQQLLDAKQEPQDSPWRGELLKLQEALALA